jgi:hypothetical protein
MDDSATLRLFRHGGIPPHYRDKPRPGPPQGWAAASRSAIRRASHSRDLEFDPLITSFAITGTATGRDIAGSRTMTARTTQLFPYPVFEGPAAEPSWNQEAAQTFFPRLAHATPAL